MPNTIALAKNYINNLDEVYRLASVTSDLTSDPTMSKAGANANEIVYPQISVSGLGDYDRNSGYTTGAVDLKWKTATFNYDRGTRISVDVMDNEESRNLAFGMAGATLMREKAAPEADAFAFATLAALDGISKATGTIADASQFLDALLTAWSKMDEDEVPQEQRVLYATATLLNSVMALDTTKSREILGKFAVKKAVPQARFYTAIEMLDGKSSGEELGHYKKATSAADINFMIIHKPAVIKFDKHIASNIIPAETNPDADADIIKYRKYGLVEAYANKRAGIYLNSKA
nr:MAG TPA: Major capsid protein [Caudoviricetes sp.]